MKKKVIFSFIKDKFSFSIFFFINTFLIILFFYLTFGNTVEIIYPITISVFLYLILLINEWRKYYRFNSSLFRSSDNINYELEPSTCEQKEFSGVINKIHYMYTNKIAMINASNQNQKHFLSQWIHNMKTPISVIDLILQKTPFSSPDSPNILEDYKNIKEENNRLSSNLEQVLNFIRLEDFSKDYVPTTVDLLASIKKVINNKKNQFIYSNVFPKVICEKERILVLSDNKWNEVMLEQIVSNAIKYSCSDSESKSIFFSITQIGTQTTLEIRDEGIGIPESDISRIFDPFFTGENGRKIKNATGIGLYICSVISEKLNQPISIESKVGIGTSFRISYLSKM